MTEDIKFETGETYRNMKGAFEVISIQRDAMHIRWEDGREIVTSVELQKRIIERMAYEKELQRQGDAKKKKKSAPQKQKTP